MANASLVKNATELASNLSKVPWTGIAYTLLTLLIAFLVTKFFFTLLKKVLERLAEKTKTRLDDILVKELELPIHFYILIVVFWAALTIYPGMQKYLSFFDQAILILLILNSAYFLTKLVKGLVEWYTTEKKVRRYTHNYLIVARKLINAIIYILAIIIILGELGIEISPLIASLGIGGLAVALAFQDTLANYFSGIYISTDRDLNLGDYIEIHGGPAGTITEIGWRSTKIRTWDGNLVIIPNKALAESTIIDYSKPKEPVKVGFDIEVSYKKKSDKVLKTLRKIINDIRKKYPELMTDFEPIIRIEKFGTYNVDYKVIVEVSNRANKFKFMEIFNKAIAEAYEKGDLAVDYQVVKIIK